MNFAQHIGVELDVGMVIVAYINYMADLRFCRRGLAGSSWPVCLGEVLPESFFAAGGIAKINAVNERVKLCKR